MTRSFRSFSNSVGSRAQSRRMIRKIMEILLGAGGQSQCKRHKCCGAAVALRTRARSDRRIRFVSPVHARAKLHDACKELHHGAFPFCGKTGILPLANKREASHRIGDSRIRDLTILNARSHLRPRCAAIWHICRVTISKYCCFSCFYVDTIFCKGICIRIPDNGILAT